MTAVFIIISVIMAVGVYRCLRQGAINRGIERGIYERAAREQYWEQKKMRERLDTQ